MKKLSMAIVTGLAVIVIVVFMAWVTSPDPKFNLASFEDEELVVSLAPIDEAITVAQFKSDTGEIITVLVLRYDGVTVEGIDLTQLSAVRFDDPFQQLAAIDKDRLRGLASNSADRISIPVERLLPSGSTGSRHIGTGTNFPEHAKEAGSDQVFMFPKFGLATPARTSVRAPAYGLLDYEVELCMRFDRAIASLDDFDAAVKGLFLCADFTERKALLELADPDNLDSGFGFSDAKSGPGFFPTGPFLVIPTDWASFVSKTRITTEHNGEARQDARGAEMMLSFQALTEKALLEMGNPRFAYKDKFYAIAPNERIEADMTLMSGTAEGVIFTPPARHDYIEIIIAYSMAGGPLSGKSLKEKGIAEFIENERTSEHFLQPGDVVVYRSTTLGDIIVDVTE